MSLRPRTSHLNQMVDHKGGDPGSPPLGMHQQEGDVGFVILDIRHHEAEADHHFLIEHHDAEVRVLQALGQVHAFTHTHTLITLARNSLKGWAGRGVAGYLYTIHTYSVYV